MKPEAAARASNSDSIFKRLLEDTKHQNENEKYYVFSEIRHVLEVCTNWAVNYLRHLLMILRLQENYENFMELGQIGKNKEMK